MGVKNSAVIDARYYGEVTFLFDLGVAYAPSISNIETLDSEYTLDFGNSTVLTVANGGITLEPTSKSIILNFPIGTFPQAGPYEGRLVSQQKIAGVYMNLIIKVEVEDPQ